MALTIQRCDLMAHVGRCGTHAFVHFLGHRSLTGKIGFGRVSAVEIPITRSAAESMATQRDALLAALLEVHFAYLDKARALIQVEESEPGISMVSTELGFTSDMSVTR